MLPTRSLRILKSRDARQTRQSWCRYFARSSIPGSALAKMVVDRCGYFVSDTPSRSILDARSRVLSPQPIVNVAASHAKNGREFFGRCRLVLHAVTLALVSAAGESGAYKVEDRAGPGEQDYPRQPCPPPPCRSGRRNALASKQRETDRAEDVSSRERRRLLPYFSHVRCQARAH